jgi:hypothetical protein
MSQASPGSIIDGPVAGLMTFAPPHRREPLAGGSVFGAWRADSCTALPTQSLPKWRLKRGQSAAPGHEPTFDPVEANGTKFP